jgi:hypothetical protein
MKNLKKLSLIVTGVSVLGAGLLLAQSIYRYRCPKCNAVYSYSQPSVYKCTSDGLTLIPVR